ncbi:MAG: UDP-glucose 4-epimerase GalE [Pseudomonadota bacterium]
MDKRIIVAGGAGYIGSHVCVSLIEAGYSLMVVDNFANSHPESLNRVRQITGVNDPDRLTLVEADLASPADRTQIIDAICSFQPSGAIHLAGLKAVGESVAEPVRYYQTNINATFGLIAGLEAAGARHLVFSSSATVYGDLNANPVSERGATGPTNPYGHTKLMIEQMLNDLARADARWRVCNLRYFNPVGAHPSGLIGEDPNDIPNNLFPYIAQVAVGRRETLEIFGDDYPTPDGTGVRDYIHVSDLAHGHLRALEFLGAEKKGGAHVFNLGTGIGYSVKEVRDAFALAAGREIAAQIAPRRAGDVAENYADARRAAAHLNWTAEKTLAQMCADHWRWQSQNPKGFAG